MVYKSTQGGRGGGGVQSGPRSNSLTLQKWRPSWILLTNAMTKIISGHTIMSGIAENHMVDIKIFNQVIFYRKLCQFNIRPQLKQRVLGFLRLHFVKIQ